METCCSTYGVNTLLTQKEINNIRNSIKKTQPVKFDILCQYDGCTVAELIEKLKQYDPNLRVELNTYGEDYYDVSYDVNLFVTKEIPREEKEIEKEFKRAVKCAEGEKKRAKQKEENDRKMYERLKKKFEGKAHD